MIDMKKYLFVFLLFLCSIVSAQTLTNYRGQVISKNGKLMASPDGITFLSVQPSGINQVTITLRIDVGYQVSIAWGDGNTASCVGDGSNQSYTSAYTKNNTAYLVQILGNLDHVKRFDINNESTVRFTSTTSLAQLTNLEELYLYGISFGTLNLNILSPQLTYVYLNYASAGNVVGDITSRTALTYFYVSGNNSLTGNITNLINLTTFWVSASSNANAEFTGSIQGIVNLVNLYLNSTGTALTGDVTGLTKLEIINLGSQKCTLTGNLNSAINIKQIGLFGTCQVTVDISDKLSLTNLSMQGSNWATGNITNLTSLSNLQTIHANANISGDITNLNQLSFLQVYSTKGVITGDVSNKTLLFFFNAPTNATISGSFTGLFRLLNLSVNSTYLTTNQDLSSCTQLGGVNMASCGLTNVIMPVSSVLLGTAYFYSNNIPKFDFSSSLGIYGDIRVYSNPNDTALVLPTTLTGAFTRIDAHGNALNRSSVDQMFSKLNSYFLTHTPTANLYIDVSGGTNSAPTDGWSNSDIVSLENIFSAAGKILTINKN